MSEIEKMPSPEDVRLAETLEASMASIESERKDNILENLEPGQGLQQGVELFYKEAKEAANEVIGTKDINKINLKTLLKGYIAARALRNMELKMIYATALKRKGLDDVDVLDRAINFSESEYQNVNTNSILAVYREYQKEKEV